MTAHSHPAESSPGARWKKPAAAAGGLLVVAAAGEAIVLAQAPINALRAAAFFICFALVLAAFVALTEASFVRRLRVWALHSVVWAIALPFLLLVPYEIYALGTGTFTWQGTGKFAAYIAVPTLLLLPDRHRKAERVGWRDFAAMLALAIPVGAHWLRGIWTWPVDLYFFRPLNSVCIGAYAFLVLRNLEGVGYRILWRKRDLTDALANFAGYALLAIPLGLALGFLHPHSQSVLTSPVSLSFFGRPETLMVSGNLILAGELAFQFVGIYITVALPEEFLFRGVLQNFLAKSFHGRRHELYGLLLASVIFGAAHLHHAPVPNWRYMIMATLAGIFYGNAFRTRRRTSASALTHALVDTAWHLWF
jgi:CAAX protease family protein